MKKGVLFAILFVFLLMTFSIGNVSSADDEVAKKLVDMDNDARIDLAYECLSHKIGNLTSDDDDEISEADCRKMTSEERAFTVMSTGECVDELIDESRNDGLCWPKANCDVKSTAQAIWALDSDGRDTEKAKNWILDQKSVPKDLIWYLQIETANQSFCDIRYESNTYTTEILENRKIATGAGSCLSVSENGYWLKIDPACYDYEFEIKCKESSITNLLFKEPEDSETIHVLDEIASTVEEGTTVQQIESFCFFGKDGCDYTGTLWATMVLDILEEDVSSYIPYLITGKTANLNSFPLPFLYLLTGYGEYENEILSRQINNQYWQFENGRYFDTALAVLPFQNEEPEEKANAIEWLFGVQQEDGCWEGGNIRDNSFILYSLWPKAHRSTSDIDPDDNETSDNAETCEAKGFFCMSGVNCEGTLLSNSCNAPFKCCDTAPTPELCSDDPNGVLCNDNQYCSGGAPRTTDDGNCCIGGICKNYEEPKDKPEVEEDTCSGICETFACGKGYTEDVSGTCSDGGVCCIPEESKTSYAWIWILFILIVLIVIAIIYRDKIKEFIEEMQKGKKPTPKPAVRRGPGFPSRPGMPRPGQPRPGMPRPTPMQGKPLPSQRPGQRPVPAQGRPISSQRPAQRPAQKSPKELDSVLKKLKEMSK